MKVTGKARRSLHIALYAAVAMMLWAGVAQAQHTQNDFEAWRKQSQQEFEAYKAKSEQEFRDFREKANAEFAEYMRKSWEEFSSLQGTPAPKPAELPKPPTATPEKKPTADPLPVVIVTPPPAPAPQPQPVAPVPRATPEAPKTPVTDKAAFSFLFYNTECKVSLDNTQRFSLPDASEQSVAQAWKTLSGKRYDSLIGDCIALRDQLCLSDWGYLLLLKTMSEKFLGKDSNESVLLQMFVLTQSGYKVRIARAGNSLAMLVPFKETIYEYSFLKIDDVKYYVTNKELKGQSFYVYNQEFPKEQYFSWQTTLPKLAVKLNSPKSFSAKRYPEISATVQTNQNLIDFYNSYPLSSEWRWYAQAGLSEGIKQTLYPALQRAMAGKSKVQGAEMLLNFCQTTFDYKMDFEQFGHERPFFADENFFFPYNNCKHRAVLYAILVKDLLRLDVVLLHYSGRSQPDGVGHLTTAVHFAEDVKGDYFTIEGKKFVVCDPTYIGAGIGMSMDSYKQAKAEVVRL